MNETKKARLEFNRGTFLLATDRFLDNPGSANISNLVMLMAKYATLWDEVNGHANTDKD